ncbi:MAG: hypothetical protein QM270_03300 [Bacillota bacterium]|nr:hypothetical protein [Bacillota bacterium]
MEFISCHLKYDRRRLDALENRALTREDVYETQQLLKAWDDLVDEGFTELIRLMENGFSAVSRLHKLPERAAVSPFPLDHDRLPHSCYQTEEHELVFTSMNIVSSQSIVPATGAFSERAQSARERSGIARPFAAETKCRHASAGPGCIDN